MLKLNEYMTFVRMAEDGEVQPPFTDEQIDKAEYFNVYFSNETQSYCLVLADSDGKEIASSYWQDLDFMQEYMSEYYGVDVDDDDLNDEDTLKELNDIEVSDIEDDEFDDDEEGLGED